jgi:hypothetical protein
MHKVIAAAAMLLPLLGGCASLKHGSTERIAIDTTPGGADAAIVCSDRVVASGVTPTSLAMPRRLDSCVVTLSREGYESSRVPLERGFSRYYWGNIGMAGVFPLAALVAFTSSSGDGESAFVIGGAALIAGGVGLIVDRANGSMYDHDPAQVSVQLRPTTATNDRNGPEVVTAPP